MAESNEANMLPSTLNKESELILPEHLRQDQILPTGLVRVEFPGQHFQPFLTIFRGFEDPFTDIKALP